MTNAVLTEKAENLLSLHSNGNLLVLPNIWNPIGARVLEAKGFPAVATASAAIAESLGYQDGEKLQLETMLDIVERIARSVHIPVTADIETGYGESIDELKNSIRRVIEAGIVGINIEDSLEEGGPLRSIEEQCARLSAVRSVSREMGVPLVINARTDCYLSELYPSDGEKLEESVIRAKAYGEAGADCIYVIGPGDRDTLVELRKRIGLPINSLATPGSLSLKELQTIGINRVSFGPFIFRSCLKKFVDITDELIDGGDYEAWSANTLSGRDSGVFLMKGSE